MNTPEAAAGCLSRQVGNGTISPYSFSSCLSTSFSYYSWAEMLWGVLLGAFVRVALGLLVPHFAFGQHIGYDRKALKVTSYPSLAFFSK